MKVRFDFPFLCILLSLFFQSANAAFGKQAALTVETFTLFAVLSNPFYLASLACLGFQAIVWQIALRKYPLSFAYFFMSGVFVNILLFSRFIFHEEVSLGNMVGAALIIIGLLVLTRENGQTDV
jgi:multidrug transporter EmrE-like cation transporter